MLFTLEEILNNDTTSYSLYFIKGSETIIIANNDTIRHFIKRFYGDRVYSEKCDNIGQAGSSLHSDWTMFLTRNADSIERMYLAMTSEYNPIENFDRYEDIEQKKTGSDTLAYKGSESNVKTGNVEHGIIGKEISSNGTGGIVTSNLVSGYNKSEPVLDNKSVTEGETSLEYQNRKNIDTYNQLTDAKQFSSREDETTYNTTDKTVSHLHGNIGVTTNTEMIERELELRSKNLCDILLKKFIDEVSVYF